MSETWFDLAHWTLDAAAAGVLGNYAHAATQTAWNRVRRRWRHQIGSELELSQLPDQDRLAAILAGTDDPAASLPYELAEVLQAAQRELNEQALVHIEGDVSGQVIAARRDINIRKLNFRGNPGK